MIGAKPLRIRSDKVDGFIRVYDETKYLVLLGHKKYDTIFGNIRYLINQKKNGITYTIYHNLAKIKTDSFNSSLLEKKH